MNNVELSPSSYKVFKALKTRPMTHEQLVTATDLTPRTVSGCLTWLKKVKFIHSNGTHFSLTEEALRQSEEA